MRYPAIILIFFITASLGCISASKPDTDSIYREMKSTRLFMNRKKGNASAVMTQNVGQSGFYYVIDHKGRIVYHPRGLLVGSSFIRYGFIKKIIEQRSGCIRYAAGGVQHLVFFIPLRENNILCLSIPEEEAGKGKERCSDIKL